MGARAVVSMGSILGLLTMNLACSKQTASAELWSWGFNTDRVHVWGPGEEMERSNRLKPGDSRIWRGEAEVGDEVDFSAGRNDTQIGTIRCRIPLQETTDDGELIPARLMVVWEDAFGFRSCTTVE